MVTNKFIKYYLRSLFNLSLSLSLSLSLYIYMHIYIYVCMYIHTNITHTHIYTIYRKFFEYMNIRHQVGRQGLHPSKISGGPCFAGVASSWTHLSCCSHADTVSQDAERGALLATRIEMQSMLLVGGCMEKWHTVTNCATFVPYDCDIICQTATYHMTLYRSGHSKNDDYLHVCWLDLLHSLGDSGAVHPGILTHAHTLTYT